MLVTEAEPAVLPLRGGECRQVALFFLHGRLGNAEVWMPLFRELRTKVACWALDLPGFGRSSLIRNRPFGLYEHASLIGEVLQNVIPPELRVVLVGHDVGGCLAQLCLFKYPELISGLILMNSANLARGLSRVSTNFNGRMTHWHLHRMINESSLMRAEDQAAVEAPWKDRPLRKMMTLSIRKFAASWPKHYQQQTWKNWVKEVRLPVLLLWGKKDRINPPEQATEFVQWLHESYYFLNDEVGHWPFLEKPALVSTKIREFIFRLDQPKYLKSS